MKKKYVADYKAKTALDTIKGQRSLAEIASEFEVHPNQVSQWSWGQANCGQFISNGCVTNLKRLLY